MGQEMDKLIIPVYLNQRIVFDLVAMLQDGLATVTRVVSSTDTSSEDEQRYGAAVGLGVALSSLFKIDIQGDRQKSKETAEGLKRSEERIHTPASLLKKVRSFLIERGLVSLASPTYKPSEAEFIEFSTRLERNPLIQIVENIKTSLDFSNIFRDQPKDRKNDQNMKILSQLDKFIETLKTGKSIDLLSYSPRNWHFKSVLTLEREFLNDPTLSDLTEGYFTVLAKIIRVVHDENDSINILRNTAIGIINKEILDAAFSKFSTSDGLDKLKMPKLEWEIKGPAVHVIPIAIYA